MGGAQLGKDRFLSDLLFKEETIVGIIADDVEDHPLLGKVCEALDQLILLRFGQGVAGWVVGEVEQKVHLLLVCGGENLKQRFGIKATGFSKKWEGFYIRRMLVKVDQLVVIPT